MEYLNREAGLVVDDAGLTLEANRAITEARRTAFVARFIVLREGKRTNAHRIIEHLVWSKETTAEELAQKFRDIFLQNGDNLSPVDRDIRRALDHSRRSLKHFVHEYSARATLSFVESLVDYERSNVLLFGPEDQPRLGGWRPTRELVKNLK